jgi:hypothetical protein
MGFFSKSSDFNKNHFPALPYTLGHHVSMGEPVGGKKFDMRNGGWTNVVILRVPITNYNCLVGFWTNFFLFLIIYLVSGAHAKIPMTLF